MRKRHLALILVGLASAWACGGSSDTESGGSPGTGSTPGGDASTGTGAMPSGGGGQGGASGTGSAPGAGGDRIGVTSDAALSDGACANGIDDDGDGLIDSADPECTGPMDDDEGTFATGIPGDNRDPFWQDCFFDGNSGAGDDGCRYHTDCLTGDKQQTDRDCSVTTQCVDFCRPLTPNGCDCFGCCDLTGPGGAVHTVTITATCTAADAGDPEKCPPCSKSTDCNNDCATCELCVGKDTLPPECVTPPPPGAGGSVAVDGGYCPTPVCDRGAACGSSCLPDCASDEYCLTGCCVPVPR